MQVLWNGATIQFWAAAGAPFPFSPTVPFNADKRITKNLTGTPRYEHRKTTKRWILEKILTDQLKTLNDKDACSEITVRCLNVDREKQFM